MIRRRRRTLNERNFATGTNARPALRNRERGLLINGFFIPRTAYEKKFPRSVVDADKAICELANDGFAFDGKDEAGIKAVIDGITYWKDAKSYNDACNAVLRAEHGWTHDGVEYTDFEVRDWEYDHFFPLSSNRGFLVVDTLIDPKAREKGLAMEYAKGNAGFRFGRRLNERRRLRESFKDNAADAYSASRETAKGGAALDARVDGPEVHGRFGVEVSFARPLRESANRDRSPYVNYIEPNSADYLPMKGGRGADEALLDALGLDKGDAAAVRAALKAGADVNLKTWCANSPLHLAARLDDDACTRELLKAGADVDSAGKGGDTPLMEAARWGSIENIRTLVAAGADVDARDANGAAAINKVYPKDFDAVAAVLIGAGADVNAAPSKGPYKGRTALMAACDARDVHAVERLVRAGADVDAVDGNGQTALMCAADNGAADCVRVLVAAGAYVDARDRYGDDARLLADGNKAVLAALGLRPLHESAGRAKGGAALADVFARKLNRLADEGEPMLRLWVKEKWGAGLQSRICSATYLEKRDELKLDLVYVGEYDNEDEEFTPAPKRERKVYCAHIADFSKALADADGADLEWSATFNDCMVDGWNPDNDGGSRSVCETVVILVRA